MAQEQEKAQPDLDAIARRIVEVVWRQVQQDERDVLWLDNLKAVAGIKAELARLLF